MPYPLTRLVAISVNIQMEMEEFHMGEIASWRVLLNAKALSRKGGLAHLHSSVIAGHTQAWRRTATMKIPTTCNLN